MGAGALGQSMYSLASYTYSTLRSALVADSTTANDAAAVATLPSTNPTGNGTMWLSTAQAKALGLTSGSFTDGSVGFSSGVAWDYNNSDGVTAGSYDLFGTVMHEISEVLGRATYDGVSFNGTFAYNPLDLFHYSSSGVRTFSGTTPGYFSIDGGVTNLNSFNTSSGADFGDWAGATVDAANAFGSPNVIMPFSTVDLTAMDAIGWSAPSQTMPSEWVNQSMEEV